MYHLLEVMKDIKESEQEHSFSELFMVKLLEDKGFRVLDIHPDNDRFILNGYLIEAEYNHEIYSFQAGCRFYNEYYIENLVFLLKSIRKGNSLLPVHKYAHVKNFDKDMAPYMEGYESVERLLYPADNLQVLLTKMRKDLCKEKSYTEKLQLEVSHDPFELEIPDYLFINTSFGQSVTVKLAPLSATFSLYMKDSIEKLIADWERIYTLYQSLLVKEFYLESQNCYSLVTKLFELDNQFGCKQMTLNSTIYMKTQDIQFDDFIFNVKNSEYSKQFKASLMIDKTGEQTTLTIEYMNERLTEVIPVQDFNTYFETLLVTITDL